MWQFGHMFVARVFPRVLVLMSLHKFHLDLNKHIIQTNLLFQMQNNQIGTKNNLIYQCLKVL
jgi:hypothetical protein